MLNNPNQTKAMVAGLYDRCAQSFGKIGPQIFQQLGQRLVELLDISPGSIVLDVGAGRGASLFPAAQIVGASGKVIGIDLSPVMVSETTEEINQKGLQNVEMRLMDAEDMSAFANDSFDCVLCGYAVFWFPSPKTALEECYRVLRPRGRLGVSMSANGDRRWQWYNDLLAQYHKRYHIYVDYGFDNSINQQAGSLENLLSEIGYSDIHTVVESFEFVFQDREQWWTSLWTHGTRSPLERMTAAVLEQFREEVLARLADEKQEDGYRQLWTTSFTIAAKPRSQSDFPNTASATGDTHLS